jgi:hypothetical protein
MGGAGRASSLSVEDEMAVTEAGGTNRIKAAAPVVAAALAVAAAVAGGAVLIGGNDETAAPAAVETPTASIDAAPAAPQPGSSVPGVAFDQTPGASSTQPPAVGGAQLSMEIVVKFKDDAKVKDIIDAFWRDPASAQAKFNALRAQRPEFANLKLDRVTYSNELVLVHDGSAPVEQRLPAMRATAAKLKSAADISYAEPNMTAHPGGQ